MSKNLQNFHFFYFFVIKDPLKLEANKNSISSSFLGNSVVHIHAKYRNDRMKTVGAYSIWKKWRTLFIG